MKPSKERSQYVTEIVDNLTKSGASSDKVMEVVSRLSTYDVDKVVIAKGWKYMQQAYLLSESVKKEDITYLQIYDLCANAIAVDQKNGTYNVAFTFINKKDKFNNDWKKFTIRNYVKNVYRYDGVEATSAINAICKAYNENRGKFVSGYEIYVINPVIYVRRPPENCNKPFIVIPKDMNVFPECLKKTKLKCRVLRGAISEHGIDISDIRYFTSYPDFSAMVVKKEDKFVVTFTFLSPIDAALMEKYNNGIANNRTVAKYFLYKNFLDNKFTYETDTAKNSMEAIVQMFNIHKNKFPNRYKNEHLNVEVFAFTDVDMV